MACQNSTGSASANSRNEVITMSKVSLSPSSTSESGSTSPSRSSTRLERQHISIDLAIDLAPSVHRLVESEYEDYLSCGLTATGSILKAVGPVLRETADAARHYQQGMFRQGVDVHFEERVERCEQLAEALSAMRARLDELAGCKGRTAQVASRVAKSLARSIGEAAQPSDR